MQIVAVVVLYKRALHQSQTLLSLGHAFGSSPELLRSLQVLVWDNSPEPIAESIAHAALPFPFQYRHHGYNVGVSGAYNRATQFAREAGCPWLLLLDHDTTLPGGFLPRMLDYSHRLKNDSVVASVAPFVRSHSDGAPISPTQMLRFGRMRHLQRGFQGIFPHDILAINSGTLMRVAALEEIGGYNEDFWLDLSDVYVFHTLYRKGKRMYVAGDLEIRHSCAMLDYAREMTPERYRNFMAAENAFNDLYKSRLENMVHTARLLARTLRQYRRYRNKAFASITLEYFLQRFFSSKAGRVRHWRQQLQKRDIPGTPAGTAAAAVSG